MRGRHIGSLALVASLVPSAALGRAWRVSANGEGDAPTLQAAIQVAASGDTVLVLPGAYRGEGNRDLDLLGKDVVLRSSHGAATTVLELDGGPRAPHRALRIHRGEGRGAVVEGFTVRGGWAGEDPGDPSAYGGALLCEGGASPTIARCVFLGNVAAFGGAAHLDGGAAAFVDCVFEGNRAEAMDGAGSGGGVCVSGGSARIERCSFVDNRAGAEGGGGGLAGFRGARLALESCQFTGNRAAFGGGVSADASPLDAARCAFRGNAADEGGAVSVRDETATIAECELRDNEASRAGGALAARGSAGVSIAACTFLDNRAAAFGGAASVGGEARIHFGQSTAHGNAAPRGGGIHLSPGASARIERSILAFSPAGSAVHGARFARVRVGRSNLFGNAGGDWTEGLEGRWGADGNRSVDPGFCDPTRGDVRLAFGSPCGPGDGRGASMGAHGVGCAGALAAELPRFRFEYRRGAGAGAGR